MYIYIVWSANYQCRLCVWFKKLSGMKNHLIIFLAVWWLSEIRRDFEYFACCKADPLKVSDTDLVNFVLIYFTERLAWTYWEKKTRLRWVLHLLILPSLFPYISFNVSFENLVLHKIDYSLLLLLFSLFSSPVCSTISSYCKGKLVIDHCREWHG